MNLHQTIARKIAVDTADLKMMVRDELHSSTVFFDDALTGRSLGHACVYENGAVKLYGGACQWAHVRRAVSRFNEPGETSRAGAYHSP